MASRCRIDVGSTQRRGRRGRFLNHGFGVTKRLPQFLLAEGFSLGDISAQIKSIGKAHDNGATSRTANPVKVISDGLD